MRQWHNGKMDQLFRPPAHKAHDLDPIPLAEFPTRKLLAVKNLETDLNGNTIRREVQLAQKIRDGTPLRNVPNLPIPLKVHHRPPPDLSYGTAGAHVNKARTGSLPADMVIRKGTCVQGWGNAPEVT